MTESEFYEKLYAELEQAAHQDRQLSELLKKMQSGDASFADTSAYWQKFSELTGKILKQNVTEAGSGLNEEVSYLLMKNGHMRAVQLYGMVQKALDRKQGIHIDPVTPQLMAERIRQAAHSLEDRTVSEDVIRRRAESAVSNIMNAFGDEYIRENAQFRQKAGLQCRVSRIGASKCCSWCAKLAGTFPAGSEPADFWRRHDHCTCQISYETQKVRQRLSGSGRGWKIDSEVRRRQAQRIAYKPTRFTQEQAQALESQQLSQYRGLTIPGKTDIMDAKDENSHYKPVSESAIQNMPLIPLFQARKTGMPMKDRLLMAEASEKNKRYQKACQDLLREADKHKSLPLGTEFGIVYDKNMNPIAGFTYVTGKKGSVHFDSYPDEPFHALHNHPSGETFSYSDLLIFTQKSNMLSLSAVGNQNNLYVISATSKSDRNGYSDFLNQKADEVLYTTIVNNKKIEFSYNLTVIEGKRKKDGKASLISALTKKQYEELENALIKWSGECIEGCEQYGIQYQFKKT